LWRVPLSPPAPEASRCRWDGGNRPPVLRQQRFPCPALSPYPLRLVLTDPQAIDGAFGAALGQVEGRADHIIPGPVGIMAAHRFAHAGPHRFRSSRPG
jgi:hypothetical protein